MLKFGELKRINLRNVWLKESHDFTPWIAEHIDELGKVLGLELEVTQREASVGDFTVDLLAKDLGRNSPVIIENQLTITDHDHLGKLLTYASGYDAAVVIWISESIREEHRQALEWLNQKTDEDTGFFGVVVEVLQIDDSKPAINFKPVVFPNEWRKSTKGALKIEPSEKMEKYRIYFQELIDSLRLEHNFTNAKKGQPQNWYSFSSGFSGIVYGMSFALGDKVRVEAYIDMGDRERNKNLFDSVVKDKEQIEKSYGSPLEWERMDEKKACRIAIYREGSIEEDSNALNEIKDWSIEQLIKMKKTFTQRFKSHLNTMGGQPE